LFFRDVDKRLPELTEVLEKAAELGASDVMLRRGLPIFYKVGGTWYHFSDPLGDVGDYVLAIGKLLGYEGFEERLKREKELDLSFSLPSGLRLRINVSYTSDGPLIVGRLIRQDIRFLEDLGFLEASAKALIAALSRRRGMILVTGVTGSGKSTTLAALIHWLNRNTSSNIVVIEDPIEYVFVPERSAIHQREVGSHTHSFSRALRSAMRQAPDVIMVGEMRDGETIKTALTAAETGHLVISTLHTKSAPESITRIVDALPAEDKPQARQQLASSLSIVISQKLVPATGKGKLVLAYEMFVKNDAIRNLIAKGEDTMESQIREQIRTGKQEGMILLEERLAQLVKEGVVLPETAMVYANRIEELHTQFRNYGIDPTTFIPREERRLVEERASSSDSAEEQRGGEGSRLKLFGGR
jgi:twitching motility protein PilT